VPGVGAVSQTGNKLVQVSLFAFDFNLNITGSITDPAIKMMFTSKLINKRPKPNPLYYSFNTNVE